jgi:hypothetical protein
MKEATSHLHILLNIVFRNKRCCLAYLNYRLNKIDEVKTFL